MPGLDITTKLGEFLDQIFVVIVRFSNRTTLYLGDCESVSTSVMNCIIASILCVMILIVNIITPH